VAITTLDGLVAGLKPPNEFYKVGAGTQIVGQKYNPHYAAGYPGAMSAPAGGIQGLGLLSKSGLLDWPAASNNTYLARFAAECINPGTLLLCDRLWENSGNSSTSTTAQNHYLTITGNTIANPTVVTTGAHGQAAGTFVVHITGSNCTPSIDGTYTATYISGTTFSIPVNVSSGGTAGTVYIVPPPRDRAGTAVPNGASTAYGIGVNLAVEVSGTMGANATTFTATYVNSAGVAGQVTPSITLVTAMIVGAFIAIPFAAGDVGIRALHTHTKATTQTSGTYHLVMYRVLARVGCPLASVNFAVDAITSGFPRAYDNTCPFLVWIPQSTTAPTALSGQVVWAQG
jgi:hypothetical protein